VAEKVERMLRTQKTQKIAKKKKLKKTFKRRIPTPEPEISEEVEEKKVAPSSWCGGPNMTFWKPAVKTEDKEENAIKEERKPHFE
jgi:hypothetical protein